ncbi:MAG: AAA family ATPase [Thermoplasmata archaeon]
MREGGGISPQYAEDILGRMKGEIGEVVIGYEEQVEDFLTCLISEGHLLMQGVPGVAKTTLSKTFTQVSGVSYKRIQFTQDLLPTDITGHYFYNQKTTEFELRKGPLFASIILADEINRAPPKTQSALLEAMQERMVTIEGTTFELPFPFMVVATLNPIETEGVYPLPEAQVDRFMMKSRMDYLGPEDELSLLRLKGIVAKEPKAVLSVKDVDLMREAVVGVHTHESILGYVRDIMRLSRDMEELELGLSPRGGLHLMQASKAHALLSGRDYAIPDDVKAMAHKVVDHRLILTPEAELDGQTQASVTDMIVSQVPVPKGDFKEGR